ncbi:efflux RND transporter periplasmic adaptor subunit [Aequorivita sp. CIP111184]|uniref:efflux RND transporter periplasmic adaptor subunit n=1 Tax=Aequorivita sp. CIP111184 TaxID=2211356 RepID=UPI000DBC3C38|nr:HlyD family efflux transporter periplasmic adaptor subunit [Aequorivita sp. CIP111184]SRX53869.1 hypothetical protein AEQU1_00931 [Aequorivita sp. CIP111184]
MKKLFLILMSFTALTSCKDTASNDEETTVAPKTAVEVTHIRQGSVEDNLELFATTVYLKRNVATAPIPSYITKVNIRLGDRVSKGKVLYELESKERRALGESIKLDSSLVGFGLIKVRAQVSGIVTTLDKQQPGDYVLEGAKLCTIAKSGDMVFQINVPYEYNSYIKQGKELKIVLPNDSIRLAEITTTLAGMSGTAQTQKVLAKPVKPTFLPDSLIVKALFSKSKGGQKQIVPKPALQSDEMMKDFWVMKLINDSTAVKVPVTVGNKNQNEVEILSPSFKESDRIITTGAYGMQDSTLVKITGKQEM